MLAVFDVDGVVADLGHRLHHLDPPQSWRSFFATADEDGLLAVGARLVAELAAVHEIVWLTGRPEWLRAVTVSWLTAHSLPDGELYMRPPGDYRPGALYKLSVLRRLAPRGIAAVVDDDEDVIAAAQSAGYPAILADWFGRTEPLREAQDRDGRT